MTRHRLASAGVRTALVALPIVVGVVVALAAAQLPRSAVLGDPVSGPLGLGKPVASALSLKPSARWHQGGQTIVLTVRPRRPCIAQLGAVTSTAPGRIEVEVRANATSACTGARRTQRFPVPTPAMILRGQNVSIYVNGQGFTLWAYGTPDPRAVRNHVHNR